MAVLASGNGSNLQALLDAARDPAQCLCAHVALLVCNKRGARAVARAEQAGVPVVVSVEGHKVLL